MKTTQINIDWTNEESIRAAEKLKARLENKGYTLLNQFGGLFHSVMIYALPGELNLN